MDTWTHSNSIRSVHQCHSQLLIVNHIQESQTFSNCPVVPQYNSTILNEINHFAKKLKQIQALIGTFPSRFVVSKTKKEMDPKIVDVHLVKLLGILQKVLWRRKAELL